MPKNKVAVLVVEDVPQARATAVSIMQDLGCTVFDAYNGHQALKLLQAHPEIEVLFADIRMPKQISGSHPTDGGVRSPSSQSLGLDSIRGASCATLLSMSGTDLAQAAQRLRPDLRIVLTSGYVGSKDVPAQFPFVPKPWRAQAIADVVIKVH